MNPPNALSLSRIALAALLIPLLFLPLPYGASAALVVFLLAAVSDALDGRLARRVYGVTPLGALLDPLADKVLMATAFVCFVELRTADGSRSLAPAWVVVTILAREFLVTGLRAVGERRGRHIPAGPWGKHKTAWQMVAVGAILLGLAIARDWLPRRAPERLPAFQAYFESVAYILSAAVAALTAVSGWVYFRQHRDLLADATPARTET